MHKLGKEQGINVQGIDVRSQLASVYAVPLLGEGLPLNLGELGYSKIVSRHLFPQSTYTSQGKILFFIFLQWKRNSSTGLKVYPLKDLGC